MFAISADPVGVTLMCLAGLGMLFFWRRRPSRSPLLRHFLLASGSIRRNEHDRMSSGG